MISVRILDEVFNFGAEQEGARLKGVLPKSPRRLNDWRGGAILLLRMMGEHTPQKELFSYGVGRPGTGQVVAIAVSFFQSGSVD